jgi:hypothetical protein
MVYDEWLIAHELKATQVAWQDTWAQIWWTEALNVIDSEAIEVTIHAKMTTTELLKSLKYVGFSL